MLIQVSNKMEDKIICAMWDSRDHIKDYMLWVDACRHGEILGVLGLEAIIGCCIEMKACMVTW